MKHNELYNTISNQKQGIQNDEEIFTKNKLSFERRNTSH